MRFVSLIFLILSLNSYAAGPHACAGDVQKYCQGVPKTYEALDACLDKNKENLGSSCIAARAAAEKEMKEKNKCYGDIQKLCADKKDVKEINECLKTHEKKLSKECIAQRDQRLEKNAPCTADQEKFCSEKSRGKTSVAKCMQDHGDKLSPACKTARAEFEEKLLKKKPCFNDEVKFCDDKRKDLPQLDACLRAQGDKLSKVCANSLNKMDEKMAARNPCYQDALKLCAQERFKPELLKTCLDKNESKLSKLCADTRTMAKRQSENIKASCGGDEKKFCSNIPKKGNAVVACLRANMGRISHQCRKALTD